ncbi:hypothetical protein EJ06DRAFT_533337 [Trichodelitschia bisporula]|uniref:AA9 family lytic polysaccharide monooxygenase n=1 Tax=Trichodelitschia bisporula TaxID=703511 RepID=A0A6G1HMA7_9PEZI|nr:hypothetical protein EJ06DRAFT_533337 [Trichodelitschia bisporula]
MTKSLITASLLATLATHVAAHGIVTKIVVGGTKTYQGYSPDFQYQPTPPAVIGWTAPLTQDRGFVEPASFGSPDIICHKGATPGKAVAQVVAGETIDLQWTVWPDSHKGPVMDYLADCGSDCTTVDKTQLKFFKIDGVGITNPAGTPPNFASDDMIKNASTWSVKIPASIKPGNYVLRHETIALHSAGQENGAQAYPQCINIQVTGSGTASPAGVAGTSLYKSTDPGIIFDIYRKFTSTSEYPVPGPAVFDGSSSGSAPAPVASAAPAASKASSAAAPAATVPATKPSSVAAPATTLPATTLKTSTTAAPASSAAPVQNNTGGQGGSAPPQRGQGPPPKQNNGQCNGRFSRGNRGCRR